MGAPSGCMPGASAFWRAMNIVDMACVEIGSHAVTCGGGGGGPASGAGGGAKTGPASYTSPPSGYGETGTSLPRLPHPIETDAADSTSAAHKRLFDVDMARAHTPP